MPDQTRGDDAAAHAPKPRDGGEAKTSDAKNGGPPSRQDAPNYDRRVDGGLAEPTDALNSANDE